MSIDAYPASFGRTNCDFNFKNKKDFQYNAFVCEKLQVDRFWEAMVRALAKVHPRKQ